MTYKNSYLIIILIALISGCASTPRIPRIPTIDENEAFKYERKYLAEYEQLKNNYSDQSAVKWVQPANKKVACKVYVGISKSEDRTLDGNYNIYWDGECKNGYANGLGREFERGTILNMDALAIYQGKRKEPQYFIQTYHLDNTVQEGDIGNRYYVETKVIDDGLDFNISHIYGYFGSTEKPALLFYSSPFNDTVMYTKSYLNFHYQLYDFSNEEFQNTEYGFYMLNKSMQRNGFSFEMPKIGSVINSREYNNGTVTRLVHLPESFFSNADKIFAEVKEARRKAIDSQKQALKVKKQYMSRICKKSVSVTFMDNDEYKKICRDNEYYAKLKEKIDKELMQISKAKQQKREQLNQQKIINAQVSQAYAAQRQANATLDAAEAAASAASRVANAIENRAFQERRNSLKPVPITFGPPSPWRSY